MRYRPEVDVPAGDLPPQPPEQCEKFVYPNIPDKLVKKYMYAVKWVTLLLLCVSVYPPPPSLSLYPLLLLFPSVPLSLLLSLSPSHSVSVSEGGGGGEVMEENNLLHCVMIWTRSKMKEQPQYPISHIVRGDWRKIGGLNLSWSREQPSMSQMMYCTVLYSVCGEVECSLFSGLHVSGGSLITSKEILMDMIYCLGHAGLRADMLALRVPVVGRITEEKRETFWRYGTRSSNLFNPFSP